MAIEGLKSVFRVPAVTRKGEVTPSPRDGKRGENKDERKERNEPKEGDERKRERKIDITA